MPCWNRSRRYASYFRDGVRLRYFHSGEKRPTKHQLLLEFDDFFSFGVQRPDVWPGLGGANG